MSERDGLIDADVLRASAPVDVDGATITTDRDE